METSRGETPPGDVEPSAVPSVEGGADEPLHGTKKGRDCELNSEGVAVPSEDVAASDGLRIDVMSPSDKKRAGHSLTGGLGMCAGSGMKQRMFSCAAWRRAMQASRASQGEGVLTRLQSSVSKESKAPPTESSKAL